MVTKAHIVQKIEEYERRRSIWSVGLFSACMDCATSKSTTKFYYELKNFNAVNLASLALTDELKEHHIDALKKIIKKCDTWGNATNSEVVDLYDDIKLLVNHSSGKNMNRL